MMNLKNPEARPTGQNKDLHEQGKQRHIVQNYLKSQGLCCECKYFKEKPRRTFCHFTGDKVQGLNKACEFVEVAYE